MAKKRIITLKVNGTEYEGLAEPRKLLVDFIREDIGLTGTHIGCEHGVCGACTILLNGEPVRSCIMFAVQAEGAELTTIEGIAAHPSGRVGNELHPIQEAFIAHHGLQCGFCTPGFIISALAFLQENPDPSEREIREGLSGNLCRCTGYQSIVEAVKDAAGRMR